MRLCSERKTANCIRQGVGRQLKKSDACLPVPRAGLGPACGQDLTAPIWSSTLPLLVPRIAADHPHHTVAADDFALAAYLLDGCLYFHDALYLESVKT